jgi:hypothetical protein
MIPFDERIPHGRLARHPSLRRHHWRVRALRREFNMTMSRQGDDKEREALQTDLRAHQRMGSTFLHHAAAAANDESGGRFGKANPTIVVGATPTPAYPQLPASSPWAHDPVPNEEPLGYSVNDLEPAGISLSPAAPGPVSTAAPSLNLHDEPRVGAGPLSSEEQTND